MYARMRDLTGFYFRRSFNSTFLTDQKLSRTDSSCEGFRNEPVLMVCLLQAVRYPKAAYRYIQELLGKTLANPSVKRFQQYHPYHDIIDDPERKTVIFKHNE